MIFQFEKDAWAQQEEKLTVISSNGEQYLITNRGDGIDIVCGHATKTHAGIADKSISLTEVKDVYTITLSKQLD